jgi:hypothetical protein
MDVGIYSQIALGLPLTAMQASSRHPSHRVRRGLLGHSSICVSFRIVCHTGACRATDLLPNKVASYSCLLDLSSPGKFQVGLPRASKAHGRSALAFFFFPARPQIRFRRPPRLLRSGFHFQQQTFTWRLESHCPLCPMRMRMALSQVSTA